MNAPNRQLDFRSHGSGEQPDDADSALLDEAIGHLQAGGLIACPTETVYGFGSSLAPDALDRLRALKRRSDGKPILALVPDVASVAGLAWTPAALELAEVFWPGAVTLILNDPRAIFPIGVRGEDGTVAIRQTSHPLASVLVGRLGAPVTSSSANLPGEPPALDGDEVVRTLERAGEAGRGVWILDAGRLPPSAPSTLIDCTGNVPRILRAGATPADRIRCVIPDLLDETAHA